MNGFLFLNIKYLKICKREEQNDGDQAEISVFQWRYGYGCYQVPVIVCQTQVFIITRSFMSRYESRNQYYDNLLSDARAAFKNHKISEEFAPYHWLIQRPYRDGHPGWDWCYAAEIIVTVSGSVVVTGDIGPMIYGRYSNPRTNPEGGAHWMGRQGGVTGYVRQKASIGMGSKRDAVDKWDSDIAYTDLQELVDERIDEIKEDYGDIDNDVDYEDYTEEEKEKIREELEKKLSEDEELEAYREAMTMVEDGPEIALGPIYDNITDGWEICGSIGIVPDPDVFFTWAALEKLSQLLIEREGNKNE